MGDSTNKLYEALSKAGCDVEAARARFMNNDDLYLKYLKLTPGSPDWERLRVALKGNDVKEAFAAAHLLKGTSGNLGLTPVFDAIVPMVEDFRAGNLEAGVAKEKSVFKEYDAICKVIEKYAK